MANRNYSTIKNNYELTFNVQSDIRAAQEDSSIKAQNYSFVKINSIANAEVGSTIDIIGIVKEATECTEIISKNRGGVALQKRDLTLIDESLNEVRLTIWGDKAQANTNWQVTPIVAVKGVKVGDYGGRSLSTLASSSLVINPAIPEGHMLHQWRSAYPDNNFPVQGSLSTGGPGSYRLNTYDFCSDSYDYRLWWF